MGLYDWAANLYNIEGLSRSALVRLAGRELWIGGLRRANALSKDGESHWNRDWDVLCILDACRVDMLREPCSCSDWLPPASAVDT